MNPYHELEHSANWAFRAFGQTLVELYANAAYVLFALEGALDSAPTKTRAVSIQAAEREPLLANWLNALLNLQAENGETYSKFEISELTDTTLKATIQGAPAVPDLRLLKAVTSHNLDITQTASGSWQATIVVDV